jgi:hypothetical protein
MAAPEALSLGIAGSIESVAAFDDPGRDALVEAIRARHGGRLKAILIYGSYLRGKRDTLLDFYVLVDDFSAVDSGLQRTLLRMLPPNVFQTHSGTPPEEARAKYALMTLSQFETACRTRFHSYFWARFAQPSGLLYCADETVKQTVVAAVADATRRFIREAAPMCGPAFGWRDLWVRGLGLTYRCELRSESPDQASRLVEFNAPYYEWVTQAVAAENDVIRDTGGGQFAVCHARRTRSFAWRWRIRGAQGKVLSVLRIAKASLTFEDALDYLLWKIGRHSNIYIEPTERQRRFPLLFAWPLLWRLYRRGAFR